MAEAQAELAALQAKSGELADQFLRAKAETQKTPAAVPRTKSPRPASSPSSRLPKACCPSPTAWKPGLVIKDATPEQIREGAQATLRQLVAALERNKVIAIAPTAGTKFDPHQHQAISVVPAEQEANTVVSVLQKGYRLPTACCAPPW